MTSWIRTLEWESFGCCSHWVDCCIEGHCVQDEPELFLQKCMLGKQVFVRKENVEQWRKQAQDAKDGKKPEVRSSKPVESQVTRRLVMNVKVVQSGKHFELVSWTHKDLVNYGIRAKGSEEILEQFAPTTELKGWDLRKHVVTVLKKYETENVPSPDEAPKKATQSLQGNIQKVADIEVGHILVWANVYDESKPFYAKVTRVTNHLISYRESTGSEFAWEPSSFQKLVDEKKAMVITEDQVPDGIEFK